MGTFLATVLGSVLAALLLHLVLFTVLRAVARRTPVEGDERLVRALRLPSAVLLALVAALFALTPAGWLEADVQGAVRHGLALGVIFGVAWLTIRLGRFGFDTVKRGHRIDVADNLEARRVHTQMNVLVRVFQGFVVLVALSVALMTFPRVREVGASLLASAGLAGLVLGFAARPVLENLIAGLQIALAQPIRLDDVVIVQGEWGRIETITSTYVVVRIWDERRLIVPFSKFIQEPFQNWTRTKSEILGTVVLHADYRVPVDEVRAELERIVRDHALWDGRVCNLQVTEAGERTVQLRALVSATDSGKAWDLRVDVRERLLAFLQREHPDALPRTRVEVPEGLKGASGTS